MMADWDPWTVIAYRPDVDLAYRADVPASRHGAIVQCRGITVICIRPGLPREWERYVLTEELIHLERTVRGFTMPHPDPFDILNLREERRVHWLTLRRLIPWQAIDRMLAATRWLDEVDLAHWAKKLTVPAELLLQRMTALGRRASRPEPYFQYVDNLAELPLSEKHRAWRIRPYFMPQWTG